MGRVAVAVVMFVACCSLMCPVFSQSAEQTNDSSGTIPSKAVDSKRYDDRGTTNVTYGDLDAAIKNFSRAIQLNTNDAVAYEYRGGCYALKGDLDKAIEDFNQAIVLNPTNAITYFNRGTAYRAKGDWDKALSDLTVSLKLNPTNAKAYESRAGAYWAKGEVENEISDWTSALKLTPNDAEPLAFRGYAYFKAGHFDKAIEDYYKAIKANPNYDTAYNNLAWLRATCPVAEMRNGKEAVDAATKACNLANWQNANWVDTLAAAHAETGDFEEAIADEKEAMGMDGVSKNALADMQRRLSLYKQHKPNHDGQQH